MALSMSGIGKTIVHDCASLEKIRFIIRFSFPPSLTTTSRKVTFPAHKIIWSMMLASP